MNSYNDQARRTLRKPRLRIIGAAVAVSATLGACGGGPDTSGTASVPISVGQAADPTTMDPIQQAETTTASVLGNIYDPLIRRDADDPNKYIPALAEEWELVDETTWEFQLREGVVFSNGVNFTADDVVYTVEYLLGDITGSPGILVQYFPNLVGAEALDSHTVQFHTKEPDPFLLAELPNLYIIPNESDPEVLASQPIGTGPYELVAWERNASVSLTARQDYFLGEPNISDVIFETIPDASARLAGLNAGSIDIITNLPPDNIAEVEAGGLATVAETPSQRVYGVWLNTLDDGPLQDREVRLALNYAVDVETILDTVVSGYGQQVAAWAPDYFFGHDPNREPIPFDPERARELLNSAGYADGLDITMMVPAGRFPFGEEVAQAIQSYLEAVGVNVDLEVVEFGVFADRTQSGNVDDAFFAGNGVPFNPLVFYHRAVRTGDSGLNLFSNQTIDDLIDEASITVDEKASAALLSEIEELLLQEAPFIFLYAGVDLYGVSIDVDWEPRMDEMVWFFDG